MSAAHMAGTVRPPSTLAEGVPGRLDEAILQSLQRYPAARFRSAEAMSVAIGAAADEAQVARDDETRVIRTPPPQPAKGGYVPPPAPPPMPAPRAAPSQAPIRAPSPRRQRRDGAGPWGLIGTLVILGVATTIVVLVVVPLLELGRLGGGEGGGASPSPGATATAEPGATLVTVPNLVGMSTEDAIDAARESRLKWTVYCDQDPSQPEGIIDQEPPAGGEVAPGSTFSLYSARVEDCR